MKRAIFEAFIMVLMAFLVIYNAKADLLMNSSISPAYHFMPQNIYHNIYNSSSNSNKYNKYDKYDKCNTPGSIRKIIVEKSKKEMYLLDVNNCVVKQYKVRLGMNTGPKQCDGDKKTPEGVYKIIHKKDSKYIKFLEIDYPRSKDIAKAKELKCNPGNAIGIHAWVEGLPIEGSQGCITVQTRREILEINNLVSIGTEIEIKH